jgi:Plasma-membrane choline transporter
MRSGAYLPVAVRGEDDEDSGDNEAGLWSTGPIPNPIPAEENSDALATPHESVQVLIRHDSLVPISRPPPTPRDGVFAVCYLLHFALISMLSLLEEKAMRHSLLSYSNSGSWANLLMIVTLLGSSIGVGIFCLVACNESDKMRQGIFSLGLVFDIIFQVCLGNILLLINSRYSFIGAVVLLSALSDSLRLKHAQSNVGFTSALIQVVINIQRQYGITLLLAVVTIVIAQSALLLWWGVFTIGLLSEMNEGYSPYLLCIMAFSLYWITQFFHAFMAHVIGGCVLWYFLRDNVTNGLPANLVGSNRVLLHMQCAVTTSFGSLCKGALICPLAQVVLGLHYWSQGRSLGGYMSGRGLVSSLCFPFVPVASRYHRLAHCLTATYGRTFCKAAEEQISYYPETVGLATEDATSFILSSVSTAAAGIVAIIIGLVAERQEGSSWPLFFFVVFYLCRCGVSLVLSTFSSAVDALFVAFAVQPERFATENQIIYLRLLRRTETGLM